MPTFLASIDEAGDVLVAYGGRVSFGHATAGEADLPLLADLLPVHAWLLPVETLRGGLGWELVVDRNARPPRVDGARSPQRTVPLVDGRRVAFGRGAEFLVQRRDPASASVVLELQGAGEVCGARRILLLAEGAGGRVRIGSRRRHHAITLTGLEHGIELALESGGEALGEPSSEPRGVGAAAGLRLRCAGGVRRASAPADGATELLLPLPIDERVDLSFGAAPDRRPPFAIVLRAT